MMYTPDDRPSYTRTGEYSKNFWNLMRAKQDGLGSIENHRSTETGTFSLPKSAETALGMQLAKKSLFRRLGTVVNAKGSGYRIYAKDSNDVAQWVPEGEQLPIQDGRKDFTRMSLDRHKLGALVKLDEDFVNDASFDLEGHLVGRFAKSFAKAEDGAFIAGTGIAMPTGLLHATAGAQEALSAPTLTYANMVSLYLSLKDEYREGGTWLMNDKTALALRTLSDEDGNHIWRASDDSILGKPVVYSEHMPDIVEGTMPILFGDFSYYWVIDRKPVGINVLRERFLLDHQVGYFGFEFLDGKLMRQEAIQGIRIAAA
jgi:HK97 family phage major capsid protein